MSEVDPLLAAVEALMDEIAGLMLNLSPTMALAAHDREVAARTLEAFADDKWGRVDEGRNSPTAPVLGHAMWDAELSVRERAAALRSGTPWKGMSA